MTPEAQAFVSGFIVALLHGAATLALLALGSGIYAALSPWREFERARAGEPAATVVFGAVVLALSIPLALSLLSSPSLSEIVLWGVAMGAVQLLTFRLIDAALPDVPRRMAQGDLAAAGLLAATRLASALILGAATAG